MYHLNNILHSQYFFRSSPTKLDHAVYNALSSTIYPDIYPYIYRWRHDMQLVIKRDPHRYIRPL